MEAMWRPSAVVTHHPGAVPTGLRSGSAEGISRLEFFSGIERPMATKRSQSRPRAREQPGRLIEDRGDGLAGLVVISGAKTTGRDDEVGSCERLAEGRRRQQDIAYLRDPVQRDADIGKLTRQIGSIGVGNLARATRYR